MNGLTSAGGSAGGLRVVAEGTTTQESRTIDLPVPAKLAYVCIKDSETSFSSLWAVATPQKNVLSVGTNFGVTFNSPTQLSISSPTAQNYYYLVLG